MTDHHSEGRAVHIGCAGAVSSFAASNLAPAGQRGPPMRYFGAVAPEARQGKRVMAVIHALGYGATYVRKGGPS